MIACLYLEDFGIKLPGGIWTAWKTQAAALKKVGLKVVTDPKEPHDILHLYVPFLRSRYLAGIYNKENRPLITHIHMTAEDFRNSFVGSNLIAPFFRLWLKAFYKKGDVILTPTEYTRKLAAQNYDLPLDKIIAVSNGINCEEFSPNKAKREEYRDRFKMNGEVVVFSLGWVFPRKGIYTFIDTAKKFPKTHFFWFGQMAPEKLTRLPRPIEKLPHVYFTGRIDDARGAVNAGDIFFFPSYEENQGIVVLEAAANGKAILLRDIPVFEDWMIHGKNCLKAKTDEEFCQYLKRLISDEKLRNRLGEAAQKTAREHDLARVGEKLKEVYERVIESKTTN